MKAAFLTGIRQMEIRETAPPQITDPRSVLLRVGVVGVCGSDVHYYTTGRIGTLVVNYPEWTGHECAGSVVAVGDQVKKLKRWPTRGRGPADHLRALRSMPVRPRTHLPKPELPGLPRPGAGSAGGIPGDAGKVLLRDSGAHDHGAGSGGRAAMDSEYAQRLARMQPGAKIAILGCGPIGLCVLLASRAASDCTAYVTDLLDERLATRQCGARWTGNSKKADVVKAIPSRAPGSGLRV